jgi:ABC-2 type transport system permease protein
VTDALRAEWSKTWSDRSTRWLLAGLVVATVAVSIPTILAARCPAAGCGQDPAKLSLTGVFLGQIIAAIMGVLAIGNEYSTGMIRVSLTAMPRRLELLTAKTVVLAGPVLLASVLATGASMLAGWLILPGHGFTSFGPGNAADWRASFGSVVYLTLIAVLALGVTTVVRDPAVAAGVVLGLLFLFPVLITVVSDQTAIRHLEQISPLLAGQDILTTTGLSSLPLSPWPALGVVGLWAAGAFVLGGLTLCRRDVH